MTPQEEEEFENALYWVSTRLEGARAHQITFKGRGGQVYVYAVPGRKPKPRWGVTEDSARQWATLTFDGGATTVGAGRREAIEAIAAALNRASERGEP